MLSDQQVKDFLRTYGHDQNPRFPRAMGCTRDEWDRLSLTADPILDAALSYQSLEPAVNELCWTYHNRPVQLDGDIGPATREAMERPRCGHPDYGAMEGDIIAESGTGNWLNCHGADGFHRAVVQVQNSPPPHLRGAHNGRTVWEWVKYYIWRAYAEMGLDLIFQDVGQHSGRPNMTWHFVNTAASWIGLARIGSNQVCASEPIWSQYQVRWTRGASVANTIYGWVKIGLHEIAHNLGWMYHTLRGAHASSGVMAASIDWRPWSMSWKGDPAERGAILHFGGKPIPEFDDGKDPPPREEMETWNWTQTLVDPDDNEHQYEMTMRGPAVMGRKPMWGSKSGDWGRGGNTSRHLVTFQPRF